MSYDTDIAIDLVRRALFENAAVQGLVDERVYTRHLRDEDEGSIKMPLVIIDLDRSPQVFSSTWRPRQFYIFAYSANSMEQARQLYRAVHTRLHGACLTEPAPSTFRVACHEIDDGRGGWNPQVRGWFVRGTWKVQGGS